MSRVWTVLETIAYCGRATAISSMSTGLFAALWLPLVGVLAGNGHSMASSWELLPITAIIVPVVAFFIIGIPTYLFGLALTLLSMRSRHASAWPFWAVTGCLSGVGVSSLAFFVPETSSEGLKWLVLAPMGCVNALVFRWFIMRCVPLDALQAETPSETPS